jgi:hypothetical protein
MPLFNNLGIITGSIYLYKDGNSLASSSRLVISPDFSNIGKYDFIYETTGSTPIKLLTLSSSGNDPRVGIGNENPQTTLDIKDVSDTAVGAEILVRSSRTTKGGDVGDAAGKILFVIDSGSYVDVKTSGSVAIITTEVTAINDKMAGGDLIFKVSDKGLNDPDPFEIMRLSRDTSIIPNEQVIISGYVTASGNITSNFEVKGGVLTSTTSATIGTFVYADNIRIGTNTVPTTKGLYVSGNITSSNDLSIRGFSSVSASLASLASGVGTLQQVTDAGNTTTNAISSSFPGVGFFGTASWAINVVNGGGGGGGGSDSAFLDQSTAATTWSFAHNLGTQYPVITVYDTSGQVIIPQEIDGEDTNNLKIYFPTSQSGYATAVGGTSALTYYSQSLTTASVALNTITFTKGDSSQFSITVNTGSGGGGSSFPYTGSAIISGSLIVTGSTAITGGFDALGTRGSRIQLGTYNVGYDIAGVNTFFITGAGLIISGNMPDQNHHNFLKIGNVEMVDVNTAITTNEFLIHNVNTLRITSGADGGNITTNNQLLKIGGGDFYVYRAGSGDSAGIIQSTANSTTIRDTYVTLFGQSGSYFYIPGANEITTLNGTDYLMGFVADPAPSPGISYKIKADKFIWATGSNQIISGGLTVTGSLRASSMTSSLLGTASYAITASYALSSAGGGGGVTINNNTDNYLVTATGTANTLNGEANLQFSGSTLINKGRSLFVPTGGTLSVSHQFKPTAGDNIGFLISDVDGENVFVTQGDITTNGNQKVIIGDAGDAGTNTKITIDEASGSVAVTGKFRADSIRMTDVAVGANNSGEFRVGSVVADTWSSSGPTMTPGRVVYLSGSGQWAEAVASVTGSSTGVLGVVTITGNQNDILLHGVITVSQSLAGFTNGRPVYLATSSAGTITQTVPSTAGHVARYVGYVIDSGSRQVYFNPDFTWIQI